MNLTLVPDMAGAFVIIFARVGTMVMLMPGIGERSILMRARLGFAVLMALSLMPLVRGTLPATSPGFLAGPIVGLLIGEIAIGLMLGLAIRLVMSSLHVAGNVIANQLGMSYAMQVDPVGGAQNPTIANFLTLFGVVMVFALDLHHLAIAAIHDSYRLMPPGGAVETGDAAMFAIRTVARAFSLGVQISAPFIVFGLVFNLGLGVLARLMPQFQVFFVTLPLVLIVGGLLFAATLGAMMSVYTNDLRDFLLELTVR